MTPPTLDRAVLISRLSMARQTLGELANEGISPDDLEADPIRRAAAERLLQVLIDLAVDLVVALTDMLELFPRYVEEVGRCLQDA